MPGGTTAVITLLNKEKKDPQPQYHILPHYGLEGATKGGFGVDLPHCSILFEAAKYEVHCTSRLNQANR